MYEVTEKILREVRKVIVGKDDVVEKVWISILAQGHVLLEDVPGEMCIRDSSSASSSMKAVSTRWFKNPSTLMMLPGRTRPSRRMRSFNASTIYTPLL